MTELHNRKVGTSGTLSFLLCCMAACLLPTATARYDVFSPSLPFPYSQYDIPFAPNPLPEKERDCELRLYNLAKNLTSAMEPRNLPFPAHIVRLPKSGSSTQVNLLIHLAGRDGPFQMTPSPNPCAVAEFKEGITSCTTYEPQVDKILDPSVPTITGMRNPIARAISGFFYLYEHTNRARCAQRHMTVMPCFLEYLESPQFSGVATKVFNGLPPYEPVAVCREGCPLNLANAISNMKKIDILVATDAFPLSVLLALMKYPQKPRPYFFNVFPPEKLYQFKKREPQQDEKFAEFREKYLYSYLPHLTLQNQLDIELYGAFLEEFCRRLHEAGLWRHDVVREYWNLKFTATCTGR